MNIAPKRRSLPAALMSAVMLATSLPIPTATAGMISTQQVIETAVAPESGVGTTDPRVAETTRERLQALLARDDLRREMTALGVGPAEAEARVAAMTDAELAAVAGRLDQLPAGEGVGGVLVLLFVIFGVAVLLDALGVLNILPFVCGPGECGPQAGLFPQQQAAYPEPAAGPVDDYLYQEERAPAYRRDRDRGDPYARRRESRYQTEQYYEPAPVAPSRNYYEERFGVQRPLR